MRQLGILVAAASIALIAACGSDNGEDTTAVPSDGGGSSSDEVTEPAVPVVGSRWVLSEATTSGTTVQALADPQAYLQIDEDGEVTGTTGCNSFGGSAVTGDGTITFEPLIATRKACTGELGDIDSAMLGVLRDEVTAEIAGDVLTITNSDGASLTLQASDEPATGF